MLLLNLESSADADVPQGALFGFVVDGHIGVGQVEAGFFIFQKIAEVIPEAEKCSVVETDVGKEGGIEGVDIVGKLGGSF